jgi:hypothetical protein
MSMEMFILSDKQVGSIAQWQAAIDAEGYPLKLAPDMKFETLRGFLPSHLRGELTGFECDHWVADELMRDNSDIDFGRDWKFALAFRWLGSRWNELLAAWMAATAYAQVTDGIIFDYEEERIFTPAQARTMVNDFEHPAPATVAALQEIRRRLNSKS